MTCHEAKKQLVGEGTGGRALAEDEVLKRHLEDCDSCAEAALVSRLSSALFEALREESDPGPSFYPRLRERLAACDIGQPDAALLHAWGFARRLIPALALGVILLAGAMISLEGPRPPFPLPARGRMELTAFSPEDLSAPSAVEQPTHDQMLAFVLRQDEIRGAGTDR